jgi:shikimate dehydrogenase
VNTIYKNKGYNTDYYGFGKMLEINEIPVKGQVVYILGTGGASKAVHQYLIDHHAKEVMFVSRRKRGEHIINYDALREKSGDLIVNTTPVGMYPKIDESPVSKEVIKNFKYAVDLIYNPFETKFLELAKAENLITTNGLYMLVGQAVKAEEIWQNKVISDELINKIHEMLRK